MKGLGAKGGMRMFASSLAPGSPVKKLNKGPEGEPGTFSSHAGPGWTFAVDLSHAHTHSRSLKEDLILLCIVGGADTGRAIYGY